MFYNQTRHKAQSNLKHRNIKQSIFGGSMQQIIVNSWKEQEYGRLWQTANLAGTIVIRATNTTADEHQRNVRDVRGKMKVTLRRIRKAADSTKVKQLHFDFSSHQLFQDGIVLDSSCGVIW